MWGILTKIFNLNLNLRTRLEAGIRTRLTTYSNRNTPAYLIFSLPALSLQVLFVLAILNAPVFQLSGIPGYASLAFQYLPWLLLVLSLFAIVTFRSSLCLSLLVLSYFLSAILSGSSALAAGSYLFNSGQTAVFVVAASFSCLIGFGFSRAARGQKNRTEVSSKGPLPHQLISVFLEFFFPALIATGLVAATVLVAGALRSETLQFPAPLSTVFSDFIVSPIVTIIIAALTLVFVKDLIEPWVLYYTINREDALKIFKQEATQMQARKGLISTLTSGGLLFSTIVTFILLTIILIAFGSNTLLADLGPVFGMGKPTAEASSLIRVNNGYTELEVLMKTLIRLLWG